mmetsp:Transcript_56152/g.87438  ORF Transcript_56152/g.87438 Transcript_56152/m.87438 type:complete len:280 (+) Transcript_56152:669-1508(+)
MLPCRPAVHNCTNPLSKTGYHHRRLHWRERVSLGASGHASHHRVRRLDCDCQIEHVFLHRAASAVAHLWHHVFCHHPRRDVVAFGGHAHIQLGDAVFSGHARVLDHLRDLHAHVLDHLYDHFFLHAVVVGRNALLVAGFGCGCGCDYRFDFGFGFDLDRGHCGRRGGSAHPSAQHLYCHERLHDLGLGCDRGSDLAFHYGRHACLLDRPSSASANPLALWSRLPLRSKVSLRPHLDHPTPSQVLQRLSPRRIRRWPIASALFACRKWLPSSQHQRRCTS